MYRAEAFTLPVYGGGIKGHDSPAALSRRGLRGLWGDQAAWAARHGTEASAMATPASESPPGRKVMQHAPMGLCCGLGLRRTMALWQQQRLVFGAAAGCTTQWRHPLPLATAS